MNNLSAAKSPPLTGIDLAEPDEHPEVMIPQTRPQTNLATGFASCADPVTMIDRHGTLSGPVFALAGWRNATAKKFHMSADEGHLVDWNDKARSIVDPAGGCLCGVYAPARDIAVLTPSGALRPGTTPRGKSSDGF